MVNRDQEGSMSHFTLRLGNISPFHPFARRTVCPAKTLLRAQPPSLGNGPWASRPEDLAFFGLCRQTGNQNPRDEMARLALENDDMDRGDGRDESWLILP